MKTQREKEEKEGNDKDATCCSTPTISQGASSLSLLGHSHDAGGQHYRLSPKRSETRRVCITTLPKRETQGFMQVFHAKLILQN